MSATRTRALVDLPLPLRLRLRRVLSAARHHRSELPDDAAAASHTGADRLAAVVDAARLHGAAVPGRCHRSAPRGAPDVRDHQPAGVCRYARHTALATAA